eukprot:1288596-Pleurochrysis_carterae.AAC.1
MGPYLELLPSERAGTSFLVQITYKDGYGRTRVRGLSAPEAVARQYLSRGLQDNVLGFNNREGEEKIDVDRDFLGIISLNSWLDDLTIATGGASKCYVPKRALALP